MNRPLLGGVLLAVLSPLWLGTAPQAAVAAPTCAGVWVVVDYGSLGGIDTGCATSHGTGLAALRSAGFSPTVEDGFVLKIEGKPSSPNPKSAYWSYWQAKRQDDGSYSAWSYSNLGATASHPKQGNAEGWRFQDLSDGKVPPGAKPPKADAPTPTPSATKTGTPTAKPTATKQPTAKPTASKKPTATATATKQPTATASSTKSASATPTPTPTTAAPTDSATPVVTAEPATPSPVEEASTEVAGEEITDTAPPTDSGSPLGAIVAGGLVVAGGVGAGGWWLLKGRKR